MFSLADGWTLQSIIQYVANSYAVQYLTISDIVDAYEVTEAAIKEYAKAVAGNATVAYSFVEASIAFDNANHYSVRTTIKLTENKHVSFEDKAAIDMLYKQYFNYILLNDLLQTVLTSNDMQQISYTQSTQTIFAYSLRLKKYAGYE